MGLPAKFDLVLVVAQAKNVILSEQDALRSFARYPGPRRIKTVPLDEIMNAVDFCVWHEAIYPIDD